MSRDIRLQHHRVVGVALALGVLVPIFFLLTSFAVVGADGAPVPCGTTVAALGRDRSTAADPSGSCYTGAVSRLHVAGAYFGAFVAVAVAVGLIASARERSLNHAWDSGRTPSRLITTPNDVWFLAGLLFVIVIGVTHANI
jgi:hypothetical protein